MKRFLQILVLTLCAIQVSGQRHPIIEQALSKVSPDSIDQYMKELTGNVPIYIDGEEIILTTRHAYDPMNQKAEEYLIKKLNSFGYEAERAPFDKLNGNNIIAVKPGTVDPDELVFIGAHFDNMPDSGRAPGADDNASGSVAVLEAARVMAGLEFPCTVIFALWDYEEQWLVGSLKYAKSLAEDSARVVGYFNMDMIAYDANNDHSAGLNVHPAFPELGQDVINVNENYNLGLDLNVRVRQSGASDYAAFWLFGLPAVGLNEDDSEFNPEYHTVFDDLEIVNKEYLEKNARLAIASTAFWALGMDIELYHTPILFAESPTGLTLEAEITSPLEIGTGENAPRLYYRLSPDDEFNYVTGELQESKVYSFNMDMLPEVGKIEYFIAATDNNKYIVKTLPAGGTDYELPGAVPDTLYRLYVTPYFERTAYDCNSLEGWTAEGAWGVSETDYISPPGAFTDSPEGNYTINSITGLTSHTPFKLTDVLGGYIRFKTKYDIQKGGDWGAFYLKEEGSTAWFTPKGTLSKPSKPQQAGTYVYDGETDWTTETIFIDSISEGNYLMRFELGTNPSTNRDGWYIDDLEIVIFKKNALDVEDNGTLPENFELAQNYPNPFNPSTVITYDMPEAGLVSLKVYDILGREAAVLVNGRKPAGSHRVNFNAEGLASGVYFYRLETRGFVSTKKMVLIR